MADGTDFLSNDFESNLSIRQASDSALFSDTPLTQDSGGRTKQISTIHRHCREPNTEEKHRTNKNYFCKYCVKHDDPSGHHKSTDGLRLHLKSHHQVVWNRSENQPRTTAKDVANQKVAQLYQDILAKGDAKGLEGEVLRRTTDRDVIQRTLTDLILVRRLPFSCVEWPELHAFVKALNPVANSLDLIPTDHTTITRWIDKVFLESQDVVRRILQSAKTPIHLAVDIWTCPNHTLLLGICSSFVDVNDNYQNILIGLRTVASQSGEDQWETLRPVLETYGIETKIGALVADNAGSNDVLCRTMAKWFSLEHGIAWNAEHQRIRCQGHIINLIVQAFLFDSKKQEEKILESYDKEDQVIVSREEDEEVVRQPSQPVKGKGKTAKANAKASSQPDRVDRGQKIREMMGPLGKLHNTVVHIGASANRTTWFKARAGKLIPLDNRTRWNSWYMMLAVAIEDKVKAGIQLYVEHYSKDLHEDDLLQTEDWLQLRTIYRFLQVFFDATLFLEGHDSTIDRVLESIDTLQDLILEAQVCRTA
jgi:hypothetical protein